MQLFASQVVNWLTGVMWITCGSLWCFYQLIGLSFWRHPFTAEDPLVRKWCNAKFLQICSDKENKLILDDLTAGVPKLNPGGLISAGQWPSEAGLDTPGLKFQFWVNNSFNSDFCLIAQILNTESELKKLAAENPDLKDAYISKQRRLKVSKHSCSVQFIIPFLCICSL